MTLTKLPQLCAAVFSLSLLSAVSAQATTVVQGTIGIDEWGYISFHYSGGTLDINELGDGWTGGPTHSGLPDSQIYLFVDNGSPVGALTGTLIATNDDSSASGWSDDGSTNTHDSYLPGQSLAAGSYILAISRYQVFEGDARGDTFTHGSSGQGDYQITFSESVDIGTTPLPATLPLFASGLGGFGLLGWRRRKKRAKMAA